MVIKEKSKGDTSGTLICPHCKKWIYIVAESFESLKEKREKELPKVKRGWVRFRTSDGYVTFKKKKEGLK